MNIVKMNRKKARQKRSRKVRNGRTERGFEFGIRHRAMLISGVDVVSELFAASVKGCGYGEIRHPVLGMIPEIFLAAVEPEPLKRALSALNNWDSAEGDDGFELEFVFLKDEGYLLGIAPNAAIIQNKLRGSDRLFEPIVTGPLFIKGMDTRHPFLLKFREYCKNVFSPFLFSGARITVPYAPPEPVDGIASILKFTAHFWDEAEVEAGSFADAMLQSRRGTLRKSRRNKSELLRPDKIEPGDIPQRRRDQLRRHFPVTLWRLSDTPAVNGFKSRHAHLPLSESQVIQAIVNLALSTAIVGDFHYKGLSRSSVPKAIHLALHDRFELADLTGSPTFADDLVLKQILLDGIALLEEVDLRPRDSHSEQVLSLLNRKGFA